MIAIVDYGVGNLGSIANMIRYVGGISQITDDPDQIRTAKKIVLPGVGHFGNGMRELEQRRLIHALNVARGAGAWILGICLGMQLMTKHSEEGNCDGLGWFNVTTRRLFPGIINGRPLAVPHMGWNRVHVVNGGCALLPPEEEASRFYFVNSYFVDAAGDPNCVCTTSYGTIEFATGVARERIFGFQFHPEKSHKYGMRVMKRFVDLANG